MKNGFIDGGVIVVVLAVGFMISLISGKIEKDKKHAEMVKDSVTVEVKR